MLSWEKKLAGIDVNQSEFPMCFACGKDNPVGLKLKIVKDGDEARGEFTVSEFYQGWRGYVHGGIIFTILDEAMAYAFFPEIRGLPPRLKSGSDSLYRLGCRWWSREGWSRRRGSFSPRPLR
jgi:hypothetical protein